MKTIVQINFRYHVPTPIYLEMSHQVARATSEADGLLWKIWLLTEAEQKAGGIYLFEDAAKAEAYVRGPLMQPLFASPHLSEIVVTFSQTSEELSMVTRAPLQMMVPIQPRIAGMAANMPYFMWT